MLSKVDKAKIHFQADLLQNLVPKIHQGLGHRIPCFGYEKNYQPLVCSMSASSIAATASPFMAPVRSWLTSSSTLGSSKCVVARTIARARFSASAGSQKLMESAMKIPEPTKTASAPN